MSADLAGDRSTELTRQRDPVEPSEFGERRKLRLANVAHLGSSTMVAIGRDEVMPSSDDRRPAVESGEELLEFCNRPPPLCNPAACLSSFSVCFIEATGDAISARTSGPSSTPTGGGGVRYRIRVRLPI